jgi:energy-coupling factor transport system ATP-binding protein
VLAAVAVALVVIGSIVPYAGAVLLLATIPFSVIVYRHRVRAAVAASAAGILIGFLLIGTSAAISLVCLALIGSLVGEVRRRGHGPGTMAVVAFILGPLLGGVVVALLLAFGRARELTLSAIRSVGNGLARVVGSVDASAGRAGRHAVDWAVDYWAVWIWVLVALVVAATVQVSWQLLGAVLDRLGGVITATEPATDAEDSELAPSPIPVTLDSVRFRYPGADSDALRGIDLRLDRPQFVVVVGDNGSGKSTLARVLAGWSPSAGIVQRAGGAGLGRPGGTALIMQRPDAQVLGLRVRDDVVWGLPDEAEVDVAGVLASVGLPDSAERDTSTLSGGELQRLAVAAAIVRRPALLISDESTAMVDAAGRAELVGLLADLPGRAGVTVVHVTHSDEEAARADRVVRLAGGRVVSDGPPSPQRRPAEAGPRAVVSDVTLGWRPTLDSGSSSPTRSTAPLLEIRGVSHSYAYGTPWQRDALTDVDLTLDEGDGLLLVGRNGSGKSTLAWIIAGLTRPSRGVCLLDGRPTNRQTGSVGLALQHARLQLQRPTVTADISDAAGWPETAAMGERVAQALHRVGLDPALAGRSIDALSGGQMRRVALAGLLARRPRLLILDEPLAGLDPPSRVALLEVLTQLRVEFGLTIVVISHDLDDLGPLCPRVARIEGGRVTELGSLADLAVERAG